MSSETIANKAPESFGQKIEREALGLPDPLTDRVRPNESQGDVPIPKEFRTAVDPALYPKDGVAGDSSQAAVTSKTLYGTVTLPSSTKEESTWEEEGGHPGYDVSKTPQEVLDKIVEQAAIELGTSAAAAFSGKSEPPRMVAVQIDTLLEGSTAGDLAKFKKQVIAAFKHLGLDVRKHFGV
jgi:hypothetical protein